MLICKAWMQNKCTIYLCWCACYETVIYKLDVGCEYGELIGDNILESHGMT